MATNRKNLAAGIIANNPGLTGTLFELESGYGQTMPDVPFHMTTTPPGQLSTLGNSEIVEVTARTGDDLTVTRAAKGTTAQDVAAGWPIANGVYVEDVIGADNIDFSTLEWTDTVTSVTGMTGLTTDTLSYLKFGPTVIISFSFMGASNDSTKTIQLPYEPNSSIAYLPVHVRNNAVNNTGIVQLSAASKTAQVFRDPAANAWTASGSCRATGQLIYTTDE